MTNPTIPHGTKEQDMSGDLKPCPLCDGLMEIVEGGDYFRHVNGSGCILGEMGWSYDKIAAWNQRTPPRVKALQWHQVADDRFSAKNGDYSVSCDESGMWAFHPRDWPNFGAFPYRNEREAMQAADEDHTRRVHACLEGYDD